jgi:hypothetical protein
MVVHQDVDVQPYDSLFFVFGASAIQSLDAFQ